MQHHSLRNIFNDSHSWLRAHDSLRNRIESSYPSTIYMYMHVVRFSPFDIPNLTHSRILSRFWKLSSLFWSISLHPGAPGEDPSSGAPKRNGQSRKNPSRFKDFIIAEGIVFGMVSIFNFQRSPHMTSFNIVLSFHLYMTWAIFYESQFVLKFLKISTVGFWRLEVTLYSVVLKQYRCDFKILISVCNRIISKILHSFEHSF